MTTCVCGHAEFLHTSIGCLKWFLSCGCTSYEPDDGTDSVLGNVKSEPYVGRYAGKCGAP